MGHRIALKGHLRALGALLLCAAACAAPAATRSDHGALGAIPGSTFVTNGLVQAVVRSGDTLYIGGRFDRVGPRTGPGIELAPDGTQTSNVPEVSGGEATVSAVAADGAGGWYVAGHFTHVGGVARNNIAHILADHSVDAAFNPDANDAIHALAVSGSTVYTAGLFTSIGGQSRNRIAGLDAIDGTATAFDPDADAAVEALAVSDSGAIVYAGGRFATIGGQPREAIAALDSADGSATASFNPAPNNRLVLALAIADATLYVGGAFTAIGGQPRNNIAALAVADGVPTSFDPSATVGTCNACGTVATVAVAGSTVYAGGSFRNIGGQTRNFLAALDGASGAATSFDANPSSNITSVAVSASGNTVYAAGGFSTIGGQPRNFVAELDTTSGSATAFDPNPNAVATAIGVSASAVYLGGAFTSIGGVVRRSIAALNASDGTATAFDPAARFGANNGTVYALAVSGSTVYAGGFFNTIGGQPREYIAALNSEDGSATDWNPGAGATVETFVMSDPLLYVGGDFMTIGGQPRNHIAALQLADGSPTAFDPDVNNIVQTMALSDDIVYIGGFFTAVGGEQRNKLAAVSVADGSVTGWNPDATDSANVLALAVSGSTVYAGGNFSSIGGQPRQNIAAINAEDGLPTAFDPQADQGVYALAVSDSAVYAAGFFSEIGGSPRNLIAGLDPVSGAANDFDPGGTPGFGAMALSQAPDGTLYVGGSFRGFELAAQQGIASFFGEPVASVGPASLNFALTAGESDSATVTIANIGGGTLTYAMAEAPASAPAIKLALRADGSAAAHGSAAHSLSAISAGGVIGPRNAAPWSPRQADGDLSFVLDDGSYEDAVGFNDQASTESAAIWLNRFTPPAGTGAFTIDSISILWPQNANGTLVGLAANLLAYYDADGDGDPANAVRIGADNPITIASLDGFVDYTVNFNVPGDGDVYVGFENTYALGGSSPILFPAAIDQNSTLHARSWVAGMGSGDPDPDTLGNNDTLGTIDGFGLAGNWLIRATGTAGGSGGACTAPADVSWLSVTPASGSVAGGESQDATVTATTAGLDPGEYHAVLCVTTNDVNNGLVEIPVTLTVAANDTVFEDGFDGP